MNALMREPYSVLDVAQRHRSLCHHSQACNLRELRATQITERERGATAEFTAGIYGGPRARAHFRSTTKSNRAIICNNL